MKYTISIDQQKALEWGLTFAEAGLFAIIYSLPSWADYIIIDKETYYFACKTKIMTEIPLLSTKVDTIYRYYKKLEKKGLICAKKVESKDYIKLAEKAKAWNSFSKTVIGCSSDHSDDCPSELGCLSENNSDKHPTYNNTNINTNTSYNKKEKKSFLSPALFPEMDKRKKTLFKNSIVGTFEEFRKHFKSQEFESVDLSYYFNAVYDWAAISQKKRDAEGWIATARNFMRKDKIQKKLVTLKKASLELTQAEKNYLNDDFGNLRIEKD